MGLLTFSINVTLERFDRIVVIEKGRIVDSGTPQELLTRSALFRRLRNRQDDADDGAQFGHLIYQDTHV